MTVELIVPPSCRHTMSHLISLSVDFGNLKDAHVSGDWLAVKLAEGCSRMHTRAYAHAPGHFQGQSYIVWWSKFATSMLEHVGSGWMSKLSAPQV